MVNAPKNEDMQFLFSCSLRELQQLKVAVRDEMALSHYNGQALLGELMDVVDPQQVHRKKMWSSVAAKSHRFEQIFSALWR